MLAPHGSPVVIFSLFLLFISSTSYASAQTGQATPSSQAVQTERISTNSAQTKQGYLGQLVRISKLKREAAEKLVNSFEAINKRLVIIMQLNLNRLSLIIDKVDAEAKKAQANGQKVDDIFPKILALKSQISSLRSDLNRQSQMIYLPTATSEANLRSDFASVAAQLKTDLEQLRTKLELIKTEISGITKKLSQNV